MTIVCILGWNPGFKKVEFNWLLRDSSDLSLSERKVKVDLILKGEPVYVDVVPDLLSNFLERALVLGAICQVKDG